MAVEVFMPKAGMDMKEGKIINWLVEVGDEVKEGDGILEIETDKVTMEVEAPADGTLLCKYFEDGATVPVVTVIGYIGEKGEKVPDGPSVAGGEENKEEVKKEVEETVVKTETVVNTNRQKGDIPATPYAKKLAKENDVDLSEVKATGIYGEIKARDILSYCEEIKKQNKGISPLAKRIAEANGVNIDGIEGSGYNGKVMKSDVLGAMSTPAAKAADVKEATAATDDSRKRVKLSGMRKVVAERMFKSHNEIPSVTHNMRADVTELVKLRKQVNESSDVKITLNDFVIKAVTKALQKYPNILVELDGDYLVYNTEVNMGMAVGMETGLIVPVIKNTDKMSITEIAKATKDLVYKANNNKLKPDDYKGSTFTISNLGMYEVESFNPIINQPNSGILGVCTIVDELVLKDGQVAVSKKMGLSFTYDHRVIDGRQASEFLMEIKHILQNPLSILI